MDRRYKNVENMIHAWILEREKQLAGIVHVAANVTFTKEEDQKPYRPLTPLHAIDLYWDSQFLSAS